MISKIALFTAIAILFQPPSGVKAEAPANKAGAVSTPEAMKFPRLIAVANDDRLQLRVGQTAVVMTNGWYQPYLFSTKRGTLLCQAQLDEKPFNTKRKMVYPLRIG